MQSTELESKRIKLFSVMSRIYFFVKKRFKTRFMFQRTIDMLYF